MRNYIIGLIILFCASGLNAARISQISLEQCQKDALANSAEIKQKEKEAAAAFALHKSAQASLYPSVSIDGKGGWVSKTPELNLGYQRLELGDNWSYSAGPAFEYELFDYGSRNNAVKSAYAKYQAKEQELNYARKNVLFQVRQSYFTVQQDLERIFFIDGQLKLAQKQLDDVQAAFKAGAKSRLDVSMAVKQKLRAQINLSKARSALGVHLRQLFKYTANDYNINAEYPADWRAQISKNDGEATAIIKADSLPDTLKKFENFNNFIFDENSPNLASLDDMARYYELAAESYKSRLYPSVLINGGAYWEYPNALIKEHIFLGRAGAMIKIPLFEGSKNKKQAEAGRLQAEAAQFKKLDLESVLRQIFYSSKDLLKALSLEENMTGEMINAGKEIAALTYEAYKAGAVTFLEVDNANLGMLESNIALADIYIERLNRLALLDNLGREAL
jgi:outer membrane protein TolC